MLQFDLCAFGGMMMSQLDVIKEKINLLKYWMGILIGILIAVSAWLFNNAENLPNWKLWASALLISACVMMILVLNKKLLKRIDTLEDL